MPTLPPYEYKGPIDCTLPSDPSSLKNKSVIITGGAGGIGATIARTLAGHGAFVTVGDVNEEAGKAFAAEVPNINFVKCDIRNWDEQVNLFKTAISQSPNKSCDIVIANAGIVAIYDDPLFVLEDPSKEPTKPALNVLETTLIGHLYTWKLAAHYFRAQPDTDDRDRCFIMTCSLAAYFDFSVNWQYVMSKNAVKALMKCTRWVGWQQGVRVNNICPYYIRSPIMTDAEQAHYTAHGITEWAEAEDCAAAVIRITCDRTVTGRSLFVVPRSLRAEGFMDGGRDDHEGEEEYVHEWQRVSLAAVSAPWK